MSEAPGSARSQTDVVIQGIKDMLTRGELQPGSRLPIEKELAALLGVSRGSLREGVRALATLGVLETRQGDGTYVTALDPAALLSPLGFLADLQQPAHAADLLAVRRVLEAESVSLAATRITDEQLTGLEAILARVDRTLEDEDEDALDLEEFINADTEFHRAIAAASGNPPLAALVDALVGRTFRARLWRAISNRGSVREAQREHRAILDELARRDPGRASIRMSTHLLGVEQFSAEHADEDPEAT
ncbi:FadR/GntR family transcriptional regulator [Agromyces marinus]|uniref:GntR family transcriptional regulator n=1 Tax=Agromyces marinus TaxID=1389020 RepID=A0ABM8H0V0_9MICO|nr:FadR/GntR family transcriptional regulator [Agromyces marinus]UIP57510.1 HTH-type transcriptional regulator LutR [Agromyces marinus]BDZ54354.1 GntR family transcriptional regulator [Agromyces marinus]